MTPWRGAADRSGAGDPRGTGDAGLPGRGGLLRRQTIMRPDGATTRESRRRWRFRLLASCGGALAGLLTSLYPAELRALLEGSLGAVQANGLLVGLTALLASVTGVLLYERSTRRGHGRITTGTIPIQADALDRTVPADEPLVGRGMGYLEVRRPTDDLVVLLHGLGLDADDFHPYLGVTRFHSVALTQYGFSRADLGDPHYRPLSLRTHVHLLGYGLTKLQLAYPGKRISVVGFSIGADLLLLLSEWEPETVAKLRLRKALLLDPNVDATTTTFSAKIAKVGHGRTLRELADVLRSADNQAEFRYLCEYLAKIASKEWGQVRRLAQAVSARFKERSPEPFLNSFGQLLSRTEEVRVVFSLNHEAVFNGVVQAAVTRGLDVQGLECSRTDHFDLIRPAFLTYQLGRML